MKLVVGDPPRHIEIFLPPHKTKLGVFVSGGMDSAILYYLLLKKKFDTNSNHEITPLSMHRKEGSRYFANLVTAYVQQQFGLPVTSPIIVGDNTLPEEQQVKSGVDEAYRLGYERVYVGLIEQLPQHMINWQPIPHQEGQRFRTPLKTLDKSYIVELIKQFNQEALFHITHSCSVLELGRCNRCNGCNERSWGFAQLGIKDPGTL